MDQLKRMDAYLSPVTNPAVLVAFDVVMLGFLCALAFVSTKLEDPTHAYAVGALTVGLVLSVNFLLWEIYKAQKTTKVK